MPSKSPKALATDCFRVHPDGNLLAKLPAALPQELCEPLLGRPGLRVERIVSLGHASPHGFWYDQAGEEWVLLLTGAARLRFEGAPPMELGPGDHLLIPSHARHRVEWTDPDQPTVWLALHLDSPAQTEAAELSPADPHTPDLAPR